MGKERWYESRGAIYRGEKPPGTKAVTLFR